MTPSQSPTAILIARLFDRLMTLVTGREWKSGRERAWAFSPVVVPHTGERRGRRRRGRR